MLDRRGAAHRLTSSEIGSRRPDLESACRLLPDDGARRHARIRLRADDGHAEAAAAQRLGGAVAVHADRHRASRRSSACSPRLTSSDTSRRAGLRRRVLRDDGVGRIVGRAELRERCRSRGRPARGGCAPCVRSARPGRARSSTRGPELTQTRIVRCRRAATPAAGSCCMMRPAGTLSSARRFSSTRSAEPERRAASASRR